MNTMEKVRQFVARHALWRDGSRVVCAVSGGADSVCLLRMLVEMGVRVEVAHCNFRLRAAESDRDEAFVRRLCEAMGVPLHVRAFDTRAFATERHVSIEMAARQLRYEWFEQLRREQGCECVAVAHHRDDNVETMLLNLVRGTGVRGLAGMRPKNGRVVRPLLCLSRDEVMAFLTEKEQDYVVDSTNLESIYLRNKVRLEVLPLLRELNPSVDENLAVTMENVAEAERMYRYCVDEFVAASIDGADAVSIDRVMSAPSPLSVLHEILSPFGFRRSQLEDMMKCRNSVGCSFYSPTHRVLVDREQWLISATDEPLQPPVLRRTMVKMSEDFRFDPSPKFAYMDAAKVKGEECLRLAQQGDRFRPFGMKGEKLVSDFLTDLKLNRRDKERQYVWVCGGEIAWVVGRRSSETFRVDERTREVLVLEWLQ